MLRILVLDNYDSFVYNLVQYFGELGAFPMTYRNDRISLEEVERLEPDGVVISPGPGDPSDPRYFGICKDVILKLGRNVPILGVCLGHQGIVHAFGGKIVKANRLFHGKTSMIQHDGEGVFRGLKNPLKATRYHSLAADKQLPSSLKATAYALEDSEIMGVRHTSYPIEGIQFHPESALTEEGLKLLANFLEVCRR